MDLTAPHRAVADEHELEVLRVLAGTKRSLTGRDIARLVRRGSRSSVQRALGRLVESGLVEGQDAGRAILYTLNREHVALQPALSLLELRAELIHRISKAIEGWKIPPAHVSVFGSAARGDGDERSDIDLFVVRPESVDEEDPHWRSQLDELQDSIRRWSGNSAAISEVSKRDLGRLRRERPPIVTALANEAITLAGPTAEDLLQRRQ